MKILYRFSTVVITALLLTFSTALLTFAQDKHFGINPIPKEYIEIGAGMNLEDDNGNTVFSSTYKHCDNDKVDSCYLIQDSLYGQPTIVSPIFRHGDDYERVILVDEARSLLVTLELKVIDEMYEGVMYKGIISVESSSGLSETIKVTGYSGS